jgi:hypothetical protein
MRLEMAGADLIRELAWKKRQSFMERARKTPNAWCSLSLISYFKVKFTGLTQNSQVDPAVCMKIPVRALELTQILGQPCEFQVKVEARRSNALEPTGSVGIYRTMFFNKVKYLPLLRSKY